MINFVLILLGSGLVSGQLLKIPIVERNGLTLLDLTVLLSILLLTFKLKFTVKRPPVFIIFGLIFCLIGAGSVLISPASLNSNEKLISLSYAIRFLSYLFLGYLFYNLDLNTIRQRIINLFLYSGILLAVIGLFQLAFFPNLMFLTSLGWDPHYFRTVSSLLDPNFSGAFFTLTLISICLYLKNQKQKILFVITFIALLTTFSRGAYLMFGVSFFSFSIYSKSIKIFLMTAVLCILLFLGLLSYTTFVAIPRNIDRNQSAQFRVSSWQMGLQLFQKSPVLGIGFNSYRFGLKNFNIAPEEFIQSRGGSSNDSSLLHALATTGIVGFIFYILFLGAIFKKALHKKTNQNLLTLSGLGGLIIESFFANSLFYPHFLLWIILNGILLYKLDS